MTGTTGFIGKALQPKLEERGYEVHTIERYVTGRYGLDERSTKHYGNLTDYEHVNRIFREVDPDYVIHLAAISPVSFSYDNFMEVTEVNYMASVNLAEASRKLSHLDKFIVAGTSEMYGMELQDPNGKLSEQSKLIPNSPYAVAKTAFSMYLTYLYMAFKFPYIELRPFNTYGRHDNKHFFIERVITKMLENPSGNITLGDSTAIRDWMYVDDIVDGYIKALESENSVGNSINLCTGKGYTTEYTANLIASKLGFTGKIEWNSTAPRPLDARILIGDNSKAARLLGWKPKYDLSEGLDKTIEYFKGEYK